MLSEDFYSEDINGNRYYPDGTVAKKKMCLYQKIGEEEVEASLSQLKSIFESNVIQEFQFKSLMFQKKELKDYPHIILYFSPGILKCRSMDELQRWWKSMIFHCRPSVQKKFNPLKNYMKEILKNEK